MWNHGFPPTGYKIFTPVCKRALDAVRDANLVILSLPSDDVQPTLKVLEIALRRDVAVIAFTRCIPNCASGRTRHWENTPLLFPFIHPPTRLALEELSIRTRRGAGG